MEATESSLLSSDRPLSDSKHDVLGYDTFAKHLASTIARMASREGTVMAVYGEWGAGKSTLLGFVRRHLPDLPDGSRPIPIIFNPWWFSSHEDLTIRLLQQIQVAVSKSHAQAAKLAELIGKFGHAISTAPIIGGVADTVAAVADMTQRDVPSLKNQIAEQLAAQGRTFLVIIDDIDRLERSEMLQVFRAIKAVGDFPNVVYLLAFDRQIVVHALDREGIPGEEYLEKIVQVPFELPSPDKTSIRGMFFERLSMLVEETPGELFDIEYFSNVFYRGTDHFLRTPRDVVRLSNCLKALYPVVNGEVNVTDFVAIESLRLFVPEAYRIIRDNSTVFTGFSDSRQFDAKTERAFHEAWIGELKPHEQEPVRNMLQQVFPRLQGVFSNYHFGADWLPRWRSHLRICVDSRFGVYFRFSIPTGMFSQSELKAIVNLCGNSETFAAMLLKLSKEKLADGTSRARALLEALSDFTESAIPTESIAGVVTAFFSVGDALWLVEDRRKTLVDIGNDWRISWIVRDLLNRLTEPERYQVLIDAAKRGQAISTMVFEAVSSGPTIVSNGGQDIRKNDGALLDQEHADAFRALVLDRIRSAAGDGSLISAPRLPGVLLTWRDWSSHEEVRSWLDTATSSDESFLTVLTAFLHTVHSQSQGSVTTGVSYDMEHSLISMLLPSGDYRERVEGLSARTDLPEKQRTAVDCYLRLTSASDDSGSEVEA